jgi:hypothetical protein
MPLTIETLLAMPIPTAVEQARFIGVETYGDPDAATIAVWNGVSGAGALLFPLGSLPYYRSSIVTALTNPASDEAKRIVGHDLRFVIIGVFYGLFKIGGESPLCLIPQPWKVDTAQGLLGYYRGVNKVGGTAHTVGG